MIDRWAEFLVVQMVYLGGIRGCAAGLSEFGMSIMADRFDIVRQKLLQFRDWRDWARYLTASNIASTGAGSRLVDRCAMNGMIYMKYYS